MQDYKTGILPSPAPTLTPEVAQQWLSRLLPGFLDIAWSAMLHSEHAVRDAWSVLLMDVRQITDACVEAASGVEVQVEVGDDWTEQQINRDLANALRMRGPAAMGGHSELADEVFDWLQKLLAERLQPGADGEREVQAVA